MRRSAGWALNFMHYKNGREAKVGDTVVNFINNKPHMLGLLIEANPGGTTCNGKVLPAPVNNACYVTIGDCVHIDDIFMNQVATAVAP